MADKKYKLVFTMSDDTTKEVEFTAPQGEKGETGATGAAGAAGKDGNNGVGIISISIAEV